MIRTRSRHVYRPPGGEWIDDEFLKKMRPKLKNSRLFYIIRPEMDGKLKFGVAFGKGHRALGRLKAYAISYGQRSSTNKCSGVKCMYLEKTAYKPGLDYTHSLVYRIERRVIKQLGASNSLDDTRGAERVRDGVTLQQIIDVADRTRGGPTAIPKPRRSRRIRAQNRR